MIIKRYNGLFVFFNHYFPSFFFVSRSIFESIETYLETSLWSGRDLLKNYRQLSQLEIRLLNNPFKGPMKK